MLTVGTCKQKHCECFHSHHSNVQSGSTGCSLGNGGGKKVKVKKITILSPPHCALHLSRVFLQYRTNNAVECLFNVLEISFTAKTFHSGVRLLHKVYYVCSEGLGDLIKVRWWTAHSALWTNLFVMAFVSRESTQTLALWHILLIRWLERQRERERASSVSGVIISHFVDGCKIIFVVFVKGLKCRCRIYIYLLSGKDSDGAI